MIRKKNSILAAAVLLAVVSCNKQMPITPDDIVLKSGPGKFGMSYMKGMNLQGMAKSNSRGEIKEGSDARFDLGNIKGSSSFFFLLYNIGSKPITNISLNIANSNFSVYPSHMDTLMPDNDMGMLPVLKVNAFHGTQLDGVGYRPLMPKGTNTGVIQIQGTTQTAAGVDTTITFDVDLDLNALVLDVTLEGANSSVDLTNPSGNAIGNFPEHITQMSTYQVSGCDITVKNSGNVPVSLLVYYKYRNSATMFYSETLSVSLDINNQTTIPRKNTDIVLSINGSNTVSDPYKLPSYPNGRNYLAINNDPACTGTIDSTLDIQLFVSYIQAESKICSDVTNRMFVIDGTYVLWCFQGNCPNMNNNSFRLYKNIPSSQPIAFIDRTTGGVDAGKCREQSYCEMLQTMKNNLSDPNLGLGEGHTVQEIQLP